MANISFDIARGETLGLVGESGCGKSTTGKAIMQLPRPTRGAVRLDGTTMVSLSGEQLRRNRPRLQMIFQDPISVVETPDAPWPRSSRSRSRSERRHTRAARREGRGGAHRGRHRPQARGRAQAHEFSGGQCQRISIARAVITNPR